MSKFNFDGWDEEIPDQETFGEFLPTPSAPAPSAPAPSAPAPSAPAPSAPAPSASSATVSTVSSSVIKDGHSTTDSTRWCKLCHRKPCDYITKAAAAVTKKPMPIRWVTSSDAGAGAGAVVVNSNREATNPSPAGAGAVLKKKYNPTMTMEPFNQTFQVQSGNSFGNESPLAPIFQDEDHSGLHRAPWREQNDLEQDFPHGVLDPSRDPNDPFGMGGGSKSSKKSSKKSSRKAKKSSRKAKTSSKKSSNKSKSKSSRKSSKKAKRS